ADRASPATALTSATNAFLSSKLNAIDSSWLRSHHEQLALLSVLSNGDLRQYSDFGDTICAGFRD
ncbi:MAG: hypothetical protein AAF290_16305, partial [Pseudomonadota bacterium]